MLSCWAKPDISQDHEIGQKNLKRTQVIIELLSRKVILIFDDNQHFLLLFFLHNNCSQYKKMTREPLFKFKISDILLKNENVVTDDYLRRICLEKKFIVKINRNVDRQIVKLIVIDRQMIR
jgi:hypothetical protein